MKDAGRAKAGPLLGTLVALGLVVTLRSAWIAFGTFRGPTFERILDPRSAPPILARTTREGRACVTAWIRDRELEFCADADGSALRRRALPRRCELAAGSGQSCLRLPIGTLRLARSELEILVSYEREGREVSLGNVSESKWRWALDFDGRVPLFACGASSEALCRIGERGELEVLREGVAPMEIDACPSGAVAIGRDGDVLLASPGRAADRSRSCSAPTSVRCHDGKIVAACSGEATVRVWDERLEHELRRIPTDALAATVDGGCIFYATRSADVAELRAVRIRDGESFLALSFRLPSSPFYPEDGLALDLETAGSRLAVLVLSDRTRVFRLQPSVRARCAS